MSCIHLTPKCALIQQVSEVLHGQEASMYQGSQAHLYASSQLPISTHFSGLQKKLQKQMAQSLFAGEFIQQLSCFEMGRFKEQIIGNAELLLNAWYQNHSRYHAQNNATHCTKLLIRRCRITLAAEKIQIQMSQLVMIQSDCQHYKRWCATVYSKLANLTIRSSHIGKRI